MSLVLGLGLLFLVVAIVAGWFVGVVDTLRDQEEGLKGRRLVIQAVFAALLAATVTFAAAGVAGVGLPEGVETAGVMLGSAAVAALTLMLVRSTDELAESSRRLNELTQREQRMREGRFVVWPSQGYEIGELGPGTVFGFKVANEGWKDSAIQEAMVRVYEADSGRVGQEVMELTAFEPTGPVDGDQRVIESGEIVEFEGKIPEEFEDADKPREDPTERALVLALKPVVGHEPALTHLEGAFAHLERGQRVHPNPPIDGEDMIG